MEYGSVSRGTRAMFFMLTPNESSFQKVEEVPQYVQQATPFFVGLMVLELLLGLVKTGAPVITIGDGITSLSAGMVSRLPLLLMRGCELSAYIYVWDHYRLVELPWDSAWTWWFTFLGVDFCYYWVHRFAHDFLFADGSGCTSIHICCSHTIKPALPILDPHREFIMLIRDLGPLEWIFNTPKHHRVHHGRNLYCIDKNYGGILIIWDRLFGTFALETEKVVYGLVFPIKRFEILYVQLHYYLYLWEKSQAYKTISNKLLTFLNGPSWKPGKRRLGDHVDNPKVTGKEVPHDPSWSLALQVYVVMHFLLVLRTYHDLFENKMMLSQLTILGMTGYVLLTLTSLGFLIDQRPTSAVLELFRCAVMVTLQRYNCVKPLVPSLAVPTEAFVSLSLLFWALHSVSQLLGIKRKAD
ncbi:alkylglycerol monooxygenase isoform X2 [Archocentrus centrarchus]|uniref:alkylglycerol monooxygenase isoform X2 n=1 Tax=Archocentrus centrarchus TaxID=63155 RepID=UPI0011E9C766|nr:alkylglycerol monooxygenase isoform X2 [Archocentrus centrarchus]